MAFDPLTHLDQCAGHIAQWHRHFAVREEPGVQSAHTECHEHRDQAQGGHRRIGLVAEVPEDRAFGVAGRECDEITRRVSEGRGADEARQTGEHPGQPRLGIEQSLLAIHIRFRHGPGPFRRGTRSARPATPDLTPGSVSPRRRSPAHRPRPGRFRARRRHRRRPDIPRRRRRRRGHRPHPPEYCA